MRYLLLKRAKLSFREEWHVFRTFWKQQQVHILPLFVYAHWIVQKSSSVGKVHSGRSSSSKRRKCWQMALPATQRYGHVAHWLGLTRDRTEMQETHLQSTISGIAAHAVSLNETTRPNGPTPQNKLGSPQEQALASEWCKHNLKDVSKYRRALARPHYLSTTLLHWQAAFFFMLLWKPMFLSLCCMECLTTNADMLFRVAITPFFCSDVYLFFLTSHQSSTSPVLFLALVSLNVLPDNNGFKKFPHSKI